MILYSHDLVWGMMHVIELCGLVSMKMTGIFESNFKYEIGAINTLSRGDPY